MYILKYKFYQLFIIKYFLFMYSYQFLDLQSKYNKIFNVFLIFYESFNYMGFSRLSLFSLHIKVVLSIVIFFIFFKCNISFVML